MALDDTVFDEWCVTKDLEGNGYGLNYILYRKLVVMTEEDNVYLWLLNSSSIARTLKR
jgi:hypothetical protein